MALPILTRGDTGRADEMYLTTMMYLPYAYCRSFFFTLLVYLYIFRLIEVYLSVLGETLLKAYVEVAGIYDKFLNS